MTGRTNTGGGGVGGILTVTAPAGVTVTVSKDGKIKTKTANTEGLAVFKGLETGTWTLTITDGENTATKTVEIVADYNTSITFFTATINITYPENAVCTATDGTTILNAPDTSGTWACIVPNSGTWKISIVDGSYAEEKNVTVNSNGQTVNITMSFDLVLFDVYNGGWKINPFTAVPVSANTVAGDPSNLNVYSESTGAIHAAMETKNGSAAYYSHGKTFDLSKYSKLYFEGFIRGTASDANVGLCVWPSLGTYWLENILARTNTVDNNTTLDISNINSPCSIGFGFYGTSYVSMYRLILRR